MEESNLGGLFGSSTGAKATKEVSNPLKGYPSDKRGMGVPDFSRREDQYQRKHHIH